jgi:hypothetical protein
VRLVWLLFHLSTSTPASTPKKIAGNVKAITTPETAVLDFEIAKTIISKTKLKRFIENWEKNSEIIKYRNGLIFRVLRIRFSLILCGFFRVSS